MASIKGCKGVLQKLTYLSKFRSSGKVQELSGTKDVCSLLTQIPLLTIIPQAFSPFFSSHPFACLCMHAQSYILFFLTHLMSYQYVFPKNKDWIRLISSSGGTAHHVLEVTECCCCLCPELTVPVTHHGGSCDGTD